MQFWELIEQANDGNHYIMHDTHYNLTNTEAQKLEKSEKIRRWNGSHPSN